jgi:fatty acid desaturase
MIAGAQDQAIFWPRLVDAVAVDPRQEMARRLPAFLQGFLTWLTAMPSQTTTRQRTAAGYVFAAPAWVLSGLFLGGVGFATPTFGAALVPLGLLFVCCGLGLFQVVIFHHCAHGTVFRTRERNRQVGRAISAVLLFKHFDLYRREHMLHHSVKRLLTPEDEFAQFIFDLCGLEPGLTKAQLWRRVVVNIVSPVFHGRFLWRRLTASLGSHDRAHNLLGMAIWLTLSLAAAGVGVLVPFLLLWVLPVTVLLQIATIFRILCEHRFPDAGLIDARDKLFVCMATTGVFPGSAPPPANEPPDLRMAGWVAWWAEMLTLQLFVRLFVLVGDAPCHDYHHRRPASKRWTSYAHARQHDRLDGCRGFPVNYCDSWGLFRTIDTNLAALAAVPRTAVQRSSASS